jgi:hypothetical protein
MIRKGFPPVPAESDDQSRTRLAIRYLPIASLKLDPKNPREHRSEKPTPESVIEEADELVIQQLVVRIRQMTGGTGDGNSDAS